jgi:hypothetical protein
MFSFASDQRVETPITHTVQEPFSFRYGYARAGETQQAGDPGQDYLAFHVQDKTFTFVICDGVSLSFCGDLAAQFLADNLLEWLRRVPQEEFQNKERMADALNSYLYRLVEEATEAVREYSLPRSLPPLLRDVLEEKRRNGSETMFVCGRIDITDEWAGNAHVFLAWSGDLRIRMWNQETEISSFPINYTNSQQCWSTRDGLVNGGVHVLTSSDIGQPVNRLVIYSDGFCDIDSLAALPSTARLQDLMNKSFSSPTSDDISFLDIAW